MVYVLVVLRSFPKLEWLLGRHNRSTIQFCNKTSLTIKVCGSEHCSNIKGKNEERLWNNIQLGFSGRKHFYYIKNTNTNKNTKIDVSHAQPEYLRPRRFTQRQRDCRACAYGGVI